MLPKTESFALTHVGLVRPHNEDFWGQIEGENFFALADGMGGHASGEVASEMAVVEVCNLMREVFADPGAPERSVEDYADLLSVVVTQVNDLIFEKGCSSKELTGMGTTFCALHLHPQGVAYAHIGDSRIYRFRNQTLEPLTRDHSLLTELIDSGEIEEEEGESSPLRNIITKAMGTDPDVTPTVKVDTLRDEDLYLICSDGLTDLISNERIEKILQDFPNLKDCATHLIDQALSEGGYDNTTVILVRILKSHEENLS